MAECSPTGAFSKNLEVVISDRSGSEADGRREFDSFSGAPYNVAMALEQRYTDEHARSGLDFPFPAIETWPNQFGGYEIAIGDPEFTSVCPKTGLPDFGVLTIRYMPRDRCAELKSLKEYLFCYRNLGIFQENVVNQVLDDLVKACDPVWAVVKGDFRPRGGIATTVEARWPRPVA